MFLKNSFEDEIFQGLKTKLEEPSFEEKFQNHKNDKILDLLTLAGELLEDAGMVEESEKVNQIIESYSLKEDEVDEPEESKETEHDFEVGD